MKSVFFITLSLLFFQQAASQSIAQLRTTTANSGSSSEFHHSGKVYLVQQSIGQPGVTGTFSVSGNTIHQGFIQPHKLHKTSHASEVRVRIYPNPYLNDFTIELDERTESIHIEITDLMGRRVLVTHATDVHVVEIRAEELAAGQYIIRLMTQKSQFVGKIVKQQ